MIVEGWTDVIVMTLCSDDVGFVVVVEGIEIQ